jgi:hypothetical protein
MAKMADRTTVHMGENSPEYIAYLLLTTLASNEQKSLHGGPSGPAKADRKWLLDTYAECLRAVQDPHGRD